MKHRSTWVLLVAMAALLLSPSHAEAWPWDKKKKPKVDPNAAKKKALAALNQKLQAARDKLGERIAYRWKTKQGHVKQRETDKETLSRLRDAQQRAYMDQARVKEQVFARDKTIEDEKRKAAAAAEEWKSVPLTLDEKLEKEAEKIVGFFPLDVELRRQALEKVRGVETKQGVVARLDPYIAYFQRFIAKGQKITLSKERILPENGSVVGVQFARFGTAMGYGLNAQGKAWVITQTGRLGEGRFSVNPIAAAELNTFLATAFPQWIASRAVSGTIVVDIIQNASSRNLISGKKETREDKIRAYLAKGGVVMYPLIGLPIWALLIMLYKFLQLGLWHRVSGWTSRKVIRALEDDDVEGANKIVQKKWGAMARVARTCLADIDRGREATEAAVKEVLLREVPGLNRHLSTLAVIAAAAPLLGLLGTVTGMISLFEVITNYGTGDPKIMASGISEALITTQTGLVVAIPILLVHNMLRNRKNRLQQEMERNSIAILNRIWPGKEKAPEEEAA